MIFDLHNDYLTSPQFLTSQVFVAQNKMAAEFNDSVIYAVWTTRLPDPIRFLKETLGLSIKRMAIEDLHFLTPQDYSVLREIMPAYASLTWNGENRLGGGANTDLGLTAEGRDAVKFLLGAGIALDTAHLSRRAFDEATELAAELAEQSIVQKHTTKAAAKVRIICSHTCFDSIFNHRRNLTDRQIRTITQSGGIIGLSLVSPFMGVKKAGLEDVIKQIDYFCGRFGHKQLCIGTDFFGTDFPALHSYGDFDILTARLLKLGYKKQEIDGIFYQNALNFFDY